MVEQKATAFRQEFYKPEINPQQIISDITSYLGEYRFEVSDLDYKLGIRDRRLTDPDTEESMVTKAARAINLRRQNLLKTSREEAELEGLVSVEQQLKERPFGTVVWFSPPGPEDEGYGRYGFGYVGRRVNDVLEMTAIRLEDPQMVDFNKATSALWGEESFQKAEDLLRSPRVINLDTDKVKEIFVATFKLREKSSRDIFQNSLKQMQGLIDDFPQIVANGIVSKIQEALYVLENLAIQLRQRYESELGGNIVSLPDYKYSDLASYMAGGEYTNRPPIVAGSCGISTSNNDIFRSINSPLGNLFNDTQEWFICPKCHYQADGPIGDTCPGCGLTKEAYAKETGIVCE